MKSEPHLIVNSNLVTVFSSLYFHLKEIQTSVQQQTQNLFSCLCFRSQLLMINCDSFAVVCPCLSQTALKCVPLGLFTPSESRPRQFSTCMY